MESKCASLVPHLPDCPKVLIVRLSAYSTKRKDKPISEPSTEPGSAGWENETVDVALVFSSLQVPLIDLLCPPVSLEADLQAYGMVVDDGFDSEEWVKEVYLDPDTTEAQEFELARQHAERGGVIGDSEPRERALVAVHRWAPTPVRALVVASELVYARSGRPSQVARRLTLSRGSLVEVVSATVETAAWVRLNEGPVTRKSALSECPRLEPGSLARIALALPFNRSCPVRFAPSLRRASSGTDSKCECKGGTSDKTERVTASGRIVAVLAVRAPEALAKALELVEGELPRAVVTRQEDAAVSSLACERGGLGWKREGELGRAVRRRDASPVWRASRESGDLSRKQEKGEESTGDTAREREGEAEEEEVGARDWLGAARRRRSAEQPTWPGHHPLPPSSPLTLAM